MSVLGLVISFGLILVAVLIIMYPMARRKPTQSAQDVSLNQQLERIQTYYERVLTNIRDLDEDFTTGKISEDDYQQERDVWVHRGIRLMKVQDQLDTQHSLVDPQDMDASNLDTAIEQAIQAYREGEQPTYHELSNAETTGS